MLEIKELSVKYESGKLALKDVNLSVEEGEKVAVVGPNGSGKSTLIKAVTGLAPITHGVVRVFGSDVRTVSYPALKGEAS